MIAKFAKKINEILIQKGIVQKEDAELYQYGIENGIVVAGNLLASGIFGIVTGRPGLVLVFLLFYASLRSYSGGSHCKSRIGCFLISMAILSIPVYTHEFVMNNVPATVILMIGIAAVVVILILSPVESINKPLDDEEKKYYARVTHCIVALQVCVLIILFCLGVKDYFYAGYSSIVLVAVFMVMGKVIMKRYI
ncbi:accessory gene regulator B family protein [Roseburia faecis]|jgi:accessory gene regulator B|nr:accessory regulator AgrB [Ruminococcus sp. OM08-13AT]RGI30369.1 accessory regulator AgrB [Ruminococcus sp. OM07-7]RGI55842.1 accessory regulator AgrB [Ruminococcus sp. OF05-2BH]